MNTAAGAVAAEATRQASAGTDAHRRDVLASKLSAALARHAAGEGRVVELQRLTGGATKETWSFDLETGGARQPMILQRLPQPAGAAKPRSPKLRAEQDAAMMLAARRSGVPAPVVVAVLDAGDGLGSGYVTERVAGETLGRKVVGDPAFASARQTMAAQAGAILAAIHRMPTSALEFLQTLTPADELSVYGELLDETGVLHPAMEYARQWVRQHLPPSSASGVVHADFRTGNLIVGPQGIACVLDWEIARIGDPMQDLGVLCMKTWRFGGAGEAGGFGRREDLYAGYEAAGGGRVDPERVRFWEALSNFKWAVSCIRRGLAVRADGSPASIELCAIGRRLEEPLWDFLELTRDSSDKVMS